MGKPASKIIEELYVGGWPRRYIVTNTDKIILVTYDYNHALKIANAIKSIENPKSFYVSLNR